MFCYVRVGIFGQLAKAGQKRTLSAVAHGDRRVAAQSGIFGALDGRAAKAFLEILAAHRGNLLELGIHESRSWLKFRGFCSWRFGRAVRSAAVPRANILADVAAEDVVSHPGAHVFRNRAALFNGEIRDAAGGVELGRSHQRSRRTRVNAARATSAEVFYRSRRVAARQRGVVGDGAYNDGPRPGSLLFQRRALQSSILIAGLQVFHLPRITRLDPGREIVKFGKPSAAQRSHATKLKTRVLSGLFGDFGDVLHSSENGEKMSTT